MYIFDNWKLTLYWAYWNLDRTNDCGSSNPNCEVQKGYVSWHLLCEGFVKLFRGFNFVSALIPMNISLINRSNEPVQLFGMPWQDPVKTGFVECEPFIADQPLRSHYPKKRLTWTDEEICLDESASRGKCFQCFESFWHFSLLNNKLRELLGSIL